MTNVYISNNCAVVQIYKNLKAEYNHPFITSLFVNDEQYIKFCKNFNYYINVKPVFGSPTNELWLQQSGSPWYRTPGMPIPYPVMYLEDIEIHWIHDHDINKLMEKYNRRKSRYKPHVHTPIFLFSAWDWMNDHTQEQYNYLLQEFMSISTSFYVTRYPSDTLLYPRVGLRQNWVGTDNQRDSSHLYQFTKLDDVERMYVNYRPAIEEKIKQTKAVFLFGDSSLWKYTQNYIKKLLQEMGNPDIYITTFYDKLEWCYEGKICLSTTLTETTPPSITKLGFAATDTYHINQCIIKSCTGQKYDKYVYIRIDALPLSLPCLDTIQPWETVRNQYTVLLSSFETSEGPIKSLSVQQRKILFKTLFEDKICDICNFTLNGLDLTDKSQIFFISSVINISPLRNNSIYSSSERLSQTVKQLKSIKKLLPDGKTVLLETSDLSLDDMANLAPHADKICLFTKDETAQYYAHKDPNKNKTEIYVISQILPFFENAPYSHFLKFGGRYWLLEQFAKQSIFNEHPTFRVISAEHNIPPIPMVNPVIYSIPKAYYEIYFNALKQIQLTLEKQFLGVEQLLYEEMSKYPIHNTQNLHVCGYAATMGSFQYI